MPLYALICDGCGHTFEVTHGMNESHPKNCPKCKKPKVRQSYDSAPAAHLLYSPMHPRVNRGTGNRNKK